MRQAPDEMKRIFDADSLERLVPVADFRKRKNLSPEEYLALEKAEEHKAHYVYFRFNTDRPSPTRTAQAYVYDLAQGSLFAGVDWGDLSALHKELWNACPVPLFIVFLHGEIRIFSSLKAPKIKGGSVQPNPLEIIKLAAKAQRGIDLFQQRIRELDIGTFWDNWNNPHLRDAKREQSVYGLMLQQLRDTRRNLIRWGKLDKRHANRVLVMALLVRYLEERTDSKGRGVFPRRGETRNGKTYPRGFFEEFAPGAMDFTSVVRAGGNVVGLFDRLSSRFNGDVFELTRDERAYLEQADLSGLADFLGGQPSGQAVFWPLYSFNHLPVELISNIYEEFLGADRQKSRSGDASGGENGASKKKRQGIVYTPPFLVDFLLAESMPLTGPTKFSVLNPACGSGVFLVGTYRRLIARWRVAHNWRRPNLQTLKNLLLENIHGVDLDADAVSLTVFSLSIALCSELEPMEIWRDLHFDRLHGKTILEGDFFKRFPSATSEKEGRFDLIIGNPPFKRSLTAPAQLLEAEAKKQGWPNVPGNEIALVFLRHSMNLLKAGGLVCLIQPAGPLLYNQQSSEFRRAFLERYEVPQILDFTHPCRKIFGKGGDIAFCAIFGLNRRSTNKGVLHVTLRRTRSVTEHIAFELDRYDFHLVPNETAKTDAFIWKANLLGGGRIPFVVAKLRTMPTLKDHLKSKPSSWVFGEGFKGAAPSDISRFEELSGPKYNLSLAEKDELVALAKKCQKVNFLTGKPYLPTDAFTAKGINDSDIRVCSETYFSAPRRPALYQPPHLLICQRAYEHGIPAVVRNDYLTFRRDVFAVHAPPESAAELQEIAEYLSRSRTVLFSLLLLSGRLGVHKSSAIQTSDILSLPFLIKGTDAKLCDWEEILRDDALDFWLDSKRKGENSRVMRVVTQEQLKEFGKTFTDFLGSVYKGLKADVPRRTTTHICYPFFFKKKPVLPDSLSLELDESLRDLTMRHHRPNVRITRILRIYERDVIYLIKPASLRYWLKSMAIRDADETFAEMTNQGF